MSAISETCNRVNDILEFVEQVKRNVINTNRNGKYELTDKLPNDVSLKKISGLHVIIV